MKKPRNESKPPRVAMIIDRYPPEFTGAGRQLASLVPRLEALGCSVTIVTGTRDSTRDEDPERVIRLDISDGPGRENAFSKAARRWLRTHRRRYDIVHAHGTSRGTVQAMIASAVMRKPSLLKFTLAGGDDPAAIAVTRFGKQKLLVLRRTVGGFIAPSSALAETCRAHHFPADKIHTIPNGVDTVRFAPLDDAKRLHRRATLRRECGWPDDGPLVLYLGSIEPRKGVDILPDVWLRISHQFPGARLVLAGPTLAGHEAYAEALAGAFAAAGDTICFAGVSDAPEHWLQACDLFLFPSRAEGLPNALIEAQACGVPAVATDLPGITSDVIADGETGCIVPRDDSTAMAAAAVRLLGDGDVRCAMSRAAASRAGDRFAFEGIAAAYYALYLKLMKRPSPVPSDSVS